MLVWSLSVTVSYEDNTWSSTEYSYSKDQFSMTGIDVSTLTELQLLWNKLDIPARGGTPFRSDITSVVYRFMAMSTNSHVNVVGSTEKLEIISNNIEEVVQALKDNPYFKEMFVFTPYAIIAGGSFVSYPQSNILDANQNQITSALGYDNDNRITTIIKKMTPAGELIWQKQQKVMSDNVNIRPSSLRISPVDGYLYSLYMGGIQKIDPNDGSTIWQKWLPSNPDIRFYSMDFKSNGDIIVTGSNYVNRYNNNPMISIFDHKTGELLKERELILEYNGNATYFLSSFGRCTLVEDRYLIFAATSYPDYLMIVIKYDIRHDNIVWTSVINDGEAYSVNVDPFGNSYLLWENYSNTGYLAKINKDGKHLWSRTYQNYHINNSYVGLVDMAFSPSGDCYILGNIYDYITTDDNLIIIKMSSDGEVIYANSIIHPESGDYQYENIGFGGWTTALDVIRHNNGSLVFSAALSYTSFTPSFFSEMHELYFRLNDDRLVEAEFSNSPYDLLQFTDYTDKIVTAPYPYTFYEVSVEAVASNYITFITPNIVDPGVVQPISILTLE